MKPHLLVLTALGGLAVASLGGLTLATGGPPANNWVDSPVCQHSLPPVRDYKNDGAPIGSADTVAVVEPDGNHVVVWVVDPHTGTVPQGWRIDPDVYKELANPFDGRIAGGSLRPPPPPPLPIGEPKIKQLVQMVSRLTRTAPSSCPQ